jgi:hypothetical protein
MFIPDPDFYPSRIPDPTTASKKRGEGKFLFYSILLSYQKYGFGIRDPGSGKNLFRALDPESKRHWIPDPGSATLLKDGRPSWPKATSYIIITSCYSLYNQPLFIHREFLMRS